MTALKFGFQIPDWHDQAACREAPLALFFIERGASSAKAKKLCSTCPVVEQCLQTALDTPWLLGIWGGTTERQRLAIRRRQAQAAA